MRLRFLMLVVLTCAACGNDESLSLSRDSGIGGGGLDGSMTTRDADVPVDAAIDADFDMDTADMAFADATVSFDAAPDSFVDAMLDASADDGSVNDASADAASGDADVARCADGPSGLTLLDDTFVGVSGGFSIRGVRTLVDGNGAPFVVYIAEEEGDRTTHLFVARRQWDETSSECVWVKHYVHEVLPEDGTGTTSGPTPSFEVAYDAATDTVVVLRTYSRFDSGTGTVIEGFLIDGFRLGDPSLYEVGDIRISVAGAFGGRPSLGHDASGFYLVYSTVDDNGTPGSISDDTIALHAASIVVHLDLLPPVETPFAEEAIPLPFSCASGRLGIPISATASLSDGTRVVAWRGVCVDDASNDRIVVSSNVAGSWTSSVVRNAGGAAYDPTLTLVVGDSSETVWVASNMPRDMLASEDVPYPPTEVDRVTIGSLSLGEPIAFATPLALRDRMFEAGGAASGDTLRFFGRRAKTFFSLPSEMDDATDGPVYATTSAPTWSFRTTELIPPSFVAGDSVYIPKTEGRGASTVVSGGGRMWGSFFVERFVSGGGSGFWDRAIWVWREPTL